MTSLNYTILEQCEGFQHDHQRMVDYLLIIPPLEFTFNVEKDDSDNSAYYIVSVNKEDEQLTTREITTLAQLQKLAVEYLDREIEIKD